MDDIVGLLRTGQANRRVGETNMNERSSRSHRRAAALALYMRLVERFWWFYPAAYALICPAPTPTPTFARCSVFTCKLQSKTVDAYGTSHIRSSR